MKITMTKLKQIIREEVGEHTKQLRQYRTKGVWRLRVSGAGERYLKPGWLAKRGEKSAVEGFFGNYDEAKIFDNVLDAIVNRNRIKDDPANIGAPELEIVGAAHEG